MSKTTETQDLPNRQEFIAFWKNAYRWGCGQIVFYVVYLGGGYAIVMHLDPTGQYYGSSLIGAIAYLILVPIITVQLVWRRYDRFIRCPQCRDWIGDDVINLARWRRVGPDPKWVIISQTGHCGKCGAQIVALGHEDGKKAGKRDRSKYE